MSSLKSDVKATIDQMALYGIDASDRADEIGEIIGEIGVNYYEPENDWEEVAEELGLI